MKKFIAILLCCMLFPLSALAANDTLAAGSSGDKVAALQSRLIVLGLLAGKADGAFGSATETAVMEAQRLLKLAGHDVPADGKADAETLRLIFDEAAKDALTTLCLGSRGARVRALQTRLIDLKLLGGTADGAFGSATETAVKSFQQKITELGAPALPATGVADAATQALVQSDLSIYGFRAPVYFDSSNPLGLTEEYLYAKSCVLIDAPTGEVLFESNARERMYPASTTKIMTLLVSLERGGLTDTVVIPEAAGKIPEDSSLVPVYPGEEMRKLDLLYGLMIRSGNDAANAVAQLDAGGVDAFVSLMNQKAAQLGLSGTHFSNPHGLPRRGALHHRVRPCHAHARRPDRPDLLPDRHLLKLHAARNGKARAAQHSKHARDI